MDGHDHINVYSQGRTELGQQLSNFAHTPFTLDGLHFASVEAWWYWRSSGDDRVRKLWGFRAKQAGKSLPVVNPSPPSREELKRVYLAKLEANPALRDQLLASTLPFEHYYLYNGRRAPNMWGWTGELWGEVREELRAHAAPTLERARFA